MKQITTERHVYETTSRYSTGRQRPHRRCFLRITQRISTTGKSWYAKVLKVLPPTQKMALSVVDPGPHLYMVPWGPLCPHPKRQLDRFIRFCRAHDRNQRTQTETDHATGVSTGRMLCYALRCGQIIKTFKNVQKRRSVVHSACGDIVWRCQRDHTVLLAIL